MKTKEANSTTTQEKKPKYDLATLMHMGVYIPQEVILQEELEKSNQESNKKSEE